MSAYSRLGTQSTWYKGSSEQPESMNLGWLDEPHSGSFTWEGVTHRFPGCTWCSANTNGSVIIHEFGHALGMVHEHQNPEGGIEWNEQAVLNYFSGAPNYWDEAQIRYNVMDKYDSNLLNASQYDPKSIMLYAFPGSLTLNGVGTQANSIMSPTDIEWMAKVYGGNGKEEEKKEVTTFAVETNGDGTIVTQSGDESKRTAFIVGVSVSVIVVGGVLALVFGVILPRKRNRLYAI